MKILVSMDILIIGFYKCIKIFQEISMKILTKNIDKTKIEEKFL